VLVVGEIVVETEKPKKLDAAEMGEERGTTKRRKRSGRERRVRKRKSRIGISGTYSRKAAIEGSENYRGIHLEIWDSLFQEPYVGIEGLGAGRLSERAIEGLPQEPRGEKHLKNVGKNSIWKEKVRGTRERRREERSQV